MPNAAIDPVTGLPVVGIPDIVDQIPLGVEPRPWADLKATDRPPHAPLYPDDMLNTLAVGVGMQGDAGRTHTMSNGKDSFGNTVPALNVYTTNSSGGGGGVAAVNWETFNTPAAQIAAGGSTGPGYTGVPGVLYGYNLFGYADSTVTTFPVYGTVESHLVSGSGTTYWTSLSLPVFINGLADPGTVFYFCFMFPIPLDTSTYTTSTTGMGVTINNNTNGSLWIGCDWFTTHQ